jgi:PAS domain S-box-containing protein
MSRVWLCRLLRPTLGKKFFLIFAFLALTGLANWHLVDAAMSNTRGMAAAINVTGSLRWLSQRIYAETARFVHGDTRDRAPVDAYLARLDEAIHSLEYGGRAHGIEIAALPDDLAADIALIGQTATTLRRLAGQALAEEQGGKDARSLLNALYQAGTSILERADAIAASLTLESDKAEHQARENLVKLGLLDLMLLITVLLGIRLRIVGPLRQLASASASFAGGQRDQRSGFRSFDEIGQLAIAFDGMADQIELDFRQMAADAQERQKREEVLRKFSLAVEHSPVSVVITDAEGKIEYVNAKFSETTGYAREEAIGRPPAILRSGQEPEAVFDEIWRTLRSGRQWRGELLSRKKDGEPFWESVSISPLKDEQGRITHFVGINKDVTERKQAEAEIVRQNVMLEHKVAERTRQLSESNRELEAFSYSVAHDLRAPLRSINGFASLVAENCEGCSRTESLDHLARIRSATLRMGNLIDDLLDLSRVARREIRREPIDLSMMARTILDTLAHAQPSRQVQISIENGLQADGDATLLHDVMENLLGNAWKFTAKRDRAHIAVGCREEGGERAYFVRDNGAGFDMKYADKLFGPFQRLHGPQEFEGTGIGLAMVRRIVALHGGRVWAEAALGEGATFHFTLGPGPSQPNSRYDASPATDA